MEGIFAILCVFGMPVVLVWLRLHYRAIEKGLIQPKALPDPEAKRRIAELEREKGELGARVANLESIVCSVDFELNQRLNRLAIEAGPLPPLAAPALAAPGSSPSEPTERRDPLAARRRPAVEALGGAALPDPPSPASATPAPGMLFGRYRVERELGRGGMGVVLLARDSQLGELVALKVLSARIGGDPAAATDRFRREASAARKVSHPNVIRIYELGESPATGELYLAMEYFPGRTLAEILRGRGPLPLDEARELLGQVCEGLAAAHRAGVIHRDLKPANILVAEAGSGPQAGRPQVKIIDFGLAKASYLSGLTATGLILGTPDYMAPEQVRGRDVDERADVYALGAVAYHVVTGHPPFSGDTPIAIGFAHCTQPVRPPERPDLPPAMSAAIVRALAKEPRERFNSVEEMRAQLVS